MRIENIAVGEIKDSRGDKTIEVSVETGRGNFLTQIPSGKSRGKNEAVSLGAENAERVLGGGLREAVKSREPSSIREIDKLLIDYDATVDKSKIGGDLALGISISFARALGAENGLDLWGILREEFFRDIVDPVPPKIFSNMINGGAHSGNNLDIQEYQIVGMLNDGPGATVDKIKELYKELGELIKKNHNLEEIQTGDEQGYAPDLESNTEPLKALTELLEKAGTNEFFLGIDVAASSFHDDGYYKFGGNRLKSDELLGVYNKYFEEFGALKYVEDPFDEGDEEGFGKISEKHGDEVIFIGDDLTTTNSKAIQKYSDIIGGVIIKANQIGTATETCEAMIEAKKAGIERIVSHRSGEVNDPFLVHFAKAAGAEGIKIGVPVIEERISKFDELIKLY